jgi:hypothetical protein
MPIRITNTEPQQSEEPRIRAEDVIAALTRVGVESGHCPACGKEGGKEGPTGFGGGYQLMSTPNVPSLPILIVACGHCGFVRHFDNRVLKVRER